MTEPNIVKSRAQKVKEGTTLDPYHKDVVSGFTFNLCCDALRLILSALRVILLALGLILHSFKYKPVDPGKPTLIQSRIFALQCVAIDVYRIEIDL